MHLTELSWRHNYDDESPPWHDALRAAALRPRGPRGESDLRACAGRWRGGGGRSIAAAGIGHRHRIPASRR